jgi:hypothetical protein
MDHVVDQAGSPVTTDTGDPVDDGTEAEGGLADLESELYVSTREMGISTVGFGPVADSQAES